MLKTISFTMKPGAGAPPPPSYIKIQALNPATGGAVAETNVANSGSVVSATFDLSAGDYIGRAVALGPGNAEYEDTAQSFAFTVVQDVEWSVPDSGSVS